MFCSLQQWIQSWALFKQARFTEFDLSYKDSVSVFRFQPRNSAIRLEIYTNTAFIRRQFFVKWFFLLCIRAKTANMLRDARCHLRAAARCDLTATGYWMPVVFPPLASLLLRSHTFIRCERPHMLTVCLFYLQCARAAQTELKHINHIHPLQLNYEDTISLPPYCAPVFMTCISPAQRWPLICLTTQTPHGCCKLSLLHGIQWITTLFTFN